MQFAVHGIKAKLLLGCTDNEECYKMRIHCNMSEDTDEVFPGMFEYHHLSYLVSTKLCLLSLSRTTTGLIRPPDSVGGPFIRVSLSVLLRFKILQRVQYIDDLMQKRCNSIANALELRLFCIKPSISWMKTRLKMLKYSKSVSNGLFW